VKWNLGEMQIGEMPPLPFKINNSVEFEVLIL